MTCSASETPSMGYYAMFEYENGFRKTMYWSKKKMLAHAEKYSQAFKRNGGAKSLELLEQGKIPEKECGSIPPSGLRILTVWP